MEWEETISSVLESLIDSFPFIVKGFHADNGSEYINKRVADLLNKLLIELTKSRSSRTNDNALVESKNGSIVGVFAQTAEKVYKTQIRFNNP